MKARGLSLVFVVVVTMAAFGLGFLKVLTDRPGPLAVATEIVIPEGEGLAAIAARLAGENVIASPDVFRLYVRLQGRDRNLRAGEFRFRPAATYDDVIDTLTLGAPVQRQLTIPEGYASAQIVAVLKDIPELTGDIAQVPEEGTLLPETYHFSRGDSRRAVIGRMRKAMDRTLAEAWRNRTPGLPLASPHEAVVLASMVEKETGIADERARVAAVFINRIRRGMRLQSDPTVAYGIAGGEGLGRPLTRRDLAAHTPYNTYRIKGLPPGPIANPGRAAIRATLNPIESDEYYFVANGSGGHAFARTLGEHNRNVVKWRRRQKQRRQVKADTPPP